MDGNEVSQTFEFVRNHLTLGLLVMTRLGMMLMSLPAIGVGVPRRVQAFLLLMMTTMLIGPVASSSGDAPDTSLPRYETWTDVAVALGHEAMAGVLIGATAQMVLTGFQLGGEAMSGTGGMQLGDAIDPTTAASTPTTARLVGLMTAAIFLIIGGHRMLVGTLVESFDAIPAGQFAVGPSVVDAVVTQLTAGMSAGIRIAAPVIAALLLSNLVTGLISRTLPQINVLAVGLPLNALALLLVLAFSIATIGAVFIDEWGEALQRLRLLLGLDQ